jgi:hypothetical protein
MGDFANAILVERGLCHVVLEKEDLRDRRVRKAHRKNALRMLRSSYHGHELLRPDSTAEACGDSPRSGYERGQSALHIESITTPCGL